MRTTLRCELCKHYGRLEWLTPLCVKPDSAPHAVNLYCAWNLRQYAAYWDVLFETSCFPYVLPRSRHCWLFNGHMKAWSLSARFEPLSRSVPHGDWFLYKFIMNFIMTSVSHFLSQKHEKHGLQNADVASTLCSPTYQIHSISVTCQLLRLENRFVPSIPSSRA